MLILTLGRFVLSNKRYTNLAIVSVFFVLVALLSLSISQIKKEEIPCHSDQSIKTGEYEKETISLSQQRLTKYRDPDYEKYNTILFTGRPKDAWLISHIHQNVLEMPNRTKGYDIQVPEPSPLERLEYFLVIKIEESSTPQVTIINKGWQVNSDVLSLFTNKMDFSAKTTIRSFVFPDVVFNQLTVQCDQESIANLLDVLWNINNLYSHSLGVYFYWVVGDKAFFLSSMAPLVIVLGLLLLFIELIAGGSFQPTIVKDRAYILLIPFLAPGLSLWFGLMEPFDLFILYSLLVLLHFPTALILASIKIAWFGYWLILSRGRICFIHKRHFDLLSHEQSKQLSCSSAQ
ncbi:hypothetical protein NEHOM01_1268 [Nematocida homosporus]|uniref:uncharacterized protein n=1 Tax=Nematocida homosporus TaxID=1912981 RepID=UPI00221EA868|nr:uncharacterized protein NEHOM01_1268 [Nematocida homosporus]KAI5186086.1 hypothetical protein NEHOM01_1268 [Nematocida homosporus]